MAGCIWWQAGYDGRLCMVAMILCCSYQYDDKTIYVSQNLEAMCEPKSGSHVCEPKSGSHVSAKIWKPCVSQNMEAMYVNQNLEAMYVSQNLEAMCVS